jgi:hypothetical protein
MLRTSFYNAHLDMTATYVLFPSADGACKTVRNGAGAVTRTGLTRAEAEWEMACIPETWVKQ